MGFSLKLRGVGRVDGPISSYLLEKDTLLEEKGGGNDTEPLLNRNIEKYFCLFIYSSCPFLTLTDRFPVQRYWGGGHGGGGY